MGMGIHDVYSLNMPISKLSRHGVGNPPISAQAATGTGENLTGMEKFPPVPPPLHLNLRND